jgi:hypothetical protein
MFSPSALLCDKIFCICKKCKYSHNVM